jgi:hypothetical protein
VRVHADVKQERAVYELE